MTDFLSVEAVQLFLSEDFRYLKFDKNLIKIILSYNYSIIFGPHSTWNKPCMLAGFSRNICIAKKSHGFAKN